MKRKYFVKPVNVLLMLAAFFQLTSCKNDVQEARNMVNFGEGWRFHLGDVENAQIAELNDADWRLLDVPHDWSIEGEFSKDNPSTPGGGALPGGIGWYRKTFSMPELDKGKSAFIDFDGVYMNSDVWINGQHLGHRPYGYISFRYELTPFLKFGGKNVIAVRVDNSQQPNSRWYSGCGIYRNVWLTTTAPVHVDHWGTYITTPEISSEAAQVVVASTVRNSSAEEKEVTLTTVICDPRGKKIATAEQKHLLAAGATTTATQQLTAVKPQLWSVRQPALYKAITRIEYNGALRDDCETTFGIRSFSFDAEKGFILNGEQLKLLGVCEHHDLGCLGSAVNTRALERQLEILKAMGCNAIRTSHNPPAPELLDLCDRMGFIVMDEAFDMWKMKKTAYDYSLYYDEWHERDLSDFIRRDRNHPSVFIWSIGNEILEQWHESGIAMAQELAGIVRKLDPTRPITSGCNDPQPKNFIIQSGALDLIGFNYHQQDFEAFPQNFPGQKFIASETGSAIATRGAYDMPSDSVRIWPSRWDRPEKYNDDYTCSAYDNCRVGWGSTHEETWRLIKKHDYLAGMFYWTGFDYLGEPTPYWWPARSSYFGIVDLAGFPKDAYWFYQSEWMDTPTLHVFPHWNWSEGDTVDVWAYTNFDEVELFLNGQSQGLKKKGVDDLDLMWRLPFKAGTLKAVAKRADGQTLTREIRTAGDAAALALSADRPAIHADGNDLSFITVDVLDAAGTLVPHADQLIEFAISGPGKIVGVDNGNPISHEPFKANYRKAFNGKCLVVVQAIKQAGTVTLTATSQGLRSSSIDITVN